MDAPLLVRVAVVALAPWAMVQLVLRVWLAPPALRRRHASRGSLSVLRDSGARSSSWTGDLTRTWPHHPPFLDNPSTAHASDSSIPLLPLTRGESASGSNSAKSAPAVRTRRNTLRAPDSASSPPIARSSAEAAPLPSTTVRLTWKSIYAESTLLGAWFAHWGRSLNPTSRLARTLRTTMAIAATLSLLWSVAACLCLVHFAWPAVRQLLADVLFPHTAGRTSPQPAAIDPEDAFAKRSLPTPQPEQEQPSGMHLVPLIPGLTIPFSHTVLLLISLLGAQLVHEVGGHALAALSVYLSRRAKRRDEPEEGGEDECLPRALGIWIPIPAWLVTAFVVFPTTVFHGGTGSRLALGHKLRILSAGVAANLASVLLFIALVGVPSSFAPRPGATVLPHSLPDLVHSARGMLHLPGGAGGGAAALLRYVGWNSDPISSALPSPAAEDDTGKCGLVATCNAKGGLRVAKVDPGSALAAAAPVVGVGSVLLSVEDTNFYSPDQPPSARNRLEAFAQSIFTSSEGRGWCVAASVWTPEPARKHLVMHSSSAAAGAPAEDLFAPAVPDGDAQGGDTDLFAPDPQPGMDKPASLLAPCSPDKAIQGSDVCFRDGQGRMRALNALALVGGQAPFQGFQGKVCRSSDACSGGGECVFPTIPLVRARFLVPGGSGLEVPSQTLLLAGTPGDALGGTTVSPYVPRDWTHVLPFPHATFDGWLMLLELGAGYVVLTSISLALLNALPLPGLDGSAIARVLLLSLGERWTASKSDVQEWDPETIEEARPAQGPSPRRLAQAHRLVAAAHRTLQGLTLLGIVALLLHGIQ